MATAVETPPKGASALAELMELPLDCVAPSPTNPRKSFPESYIAELASSIQTQGQLQAGLSRRMAATPEDVVLAKKAGLKPSFGPGDDFYQVVIGGCRLRACAVAKKPFRSEIREMDDRTVKLVQRVENLRRKDLDPLEEAQGFKDLIDDGMSLQEIANEIGDKDRSIQYVSARAKLVLLSAEAKECLTKGWLSASHAVLIARIVDPEDQERALRAVFTRDGANYVRGGNKAPLLQVAEDHAGDDSAQLPNILSEKGLREWIKENVNLELKKAPWKLEDPELYPEAGACTTCPNRSDNNQALFADIVDGTNKCMRPACFAEKRKRYVLVQINERKAAETPVAKISEKFSHTAPKENATQFKQNQWVEAKKDSCPSAVVGIFIDGENAGKAKTVCTDIKCKVHKHAAFRTSTAGSGGGNTAHDWQEEQRKRQEAAEAETKLRLLMATAAIEKVSSLNDAMLVELVARAVKYRTDRFNKLFKVAGNGKNLRDFKSSTASFAKGVAAALLCDSLETYDGEGGRREFNASLTAIGADPAALRLQFTPKKETPKPKEDAKPTKPAKTAAKSKPAKKSAKKKKGKR